MKGHFDSTYFYESDSEWFGAKDVEYSQAEHSISWRATIVMWGQQYQDTGCFARGFMEQTPRTYISSLA